MVHATSPVAVPPVRQRQALVVTVHDLAFRLYPELYPRRWRVLFDRGLRRAVARAHALIAPTRQTAEDLVRLAGADRSRVHVVPLAAAVPRDGPDPERVLERLSIPRPYVLFVGTIEPRKQVVSLVRAFRRATERAVAPHALVLAGARGWGAHDLDRELADGTGPPVVVTGAVASADLDALYRGADAFVYPSRYEGFGLPALEAMARGVPTIVSTAPALVEVVGDGAIAVAVDGVDDLADALGRVLSDPSERERLTAAGRTRAGAFSWERTARETVAVYRRAADRAA